MLFGIMVCMNPEEILRLYDAEQRHSIVFPDMQREENEHVVRYLRPAPGMSFVLYSQLNRENADAVIEAEKAYFERSNLNLEWWLFSHDQPSDLAERLLAHGLVADEPGAVMVLDLQEQPAIASQPASMDIVRLAQSSQLEDVISVMQPVWGGNFDWIRERLGGHMQTPGYLSIYVAYVHGEPASAAWTYFHPGSSFAVLRGGSTLPQYRGRGLYTSLVAVRAAEALARGCRFLTVEAVPASQPILKKNGFIHLTQVVSYNLQTVR